MNFREEKYCIYIPVGTQVSRCSGRIYDRNNESDIDITDNEELVYKLYESKEPIL